MAKIIISCEGGLKKQFESKIKERKAKAKTTLEYLMDSTEQLEEIKSERQVLRKVNTYQPKNLEKL